VRLRIRREYPSGRAPCHPALGQPFGLEVEPHDGAARASIGLVARASIGLVARRRTVWEHGPP
jgi:hypothetical protein